MDLKKNRVTGDILIATSELKNASVNSIQIIEPGTYTVEEEFLIGAPVKKFEISGDGNYALVLTVEGQLIELNLNSSEMNVLVDGDVFAFSVIRKLNNSVVVGTHDSLFVLDEGVQRAQTYVIEQYDDLVNFGDSLRSAMNQ